MSTTILLAYRNSDSRIFLIKKYACQCFGGNSFLYFKYLGFEIQLKPEQRKSIINVLRGEDAGLSRSSVLRDTEKFEFQLYIYIGKLLKLAKCYFNSSDHLMPARAGIEYFL